MLASHDIGEALLLKAKATVWHPTRKLRSPGSGRTFVLAAGMPPARDRRSVYVDTSRRGRVMATSVRAADGYADGAVKQPVA
jgi:hypothetical protein